LNLPDGVRQALWDAIQPVRDRELPVKWVRPDGIHLTLKFLGDVDDAQEPVLRAALARAASGGGGEPRERGVTLQVAGFGVFPDFHRPRVVWAGVAPDPALELLQDGVERAFAPLGFPTEARAFRPHVTLGRAARDARPRDFAGLEPALGALAFAATVLVSDLDLMQSTLQSGGAVYHVKHRERLS
jgi:2'-5' RNA ligase